jgi:signal transduction histidine kinase
MFQYVAFASVVVIFGMLFASLRQRNTYLFNPVCEGAPLALWTDDFLHLYFGGALCMTSMLIARSSVPFFGFSNGTLRHPYATILTLLISLVNTSSYAAHYFQIYPQTCVNFLDIRLSPFLFMDWIITVPFLFFLTSMLDARSRSAQWEDLYREWLAGISLVAAAITHILPITSEYSWILMFISIACMMAALAWQYLHAQNEYLTTAQEYHETCQAAELQPTDVYERYCIAICKVSLAIFIAVMFTFFPLTYFSRAIGWMKDDDLCNVILYGLSLATKFFYIQIIGDCHVEILDPHKFQLLDEKKKASESRSMFLRYVFHEVRVPLNSISLGLDFLKESHHGFQHEEVELLEMMKDASKFMEATLNDVLSLQKIDEGKLTLEMKPFAPSDLIKAVLQHLRAQYEIKEITVEAEIAANVPNYVIGDIFRLEHVLGNLLSNAIKFSDHQSKIEIRVTIETITEKGEFVRFGVKDQGIGMSEEDQQYLFQSFMQIRPGELQKGRGSGLGLSICKSLMNLHQGMIGCESRLRRGEDRESGGSEFYFMIQAPCLKDSKMLNLLERNLTRKDWSDDSQRLGPRHFSTKLFSSVAKTSGGMHRTIFNPPTSVSHSPIPIEVSSSMKIMICDGK